MSDQPTNRDILTIVQKNSELIQGNSSTIEDIRNLVQKNSELIQGNASAIADVGTSVQNLAEAVQDFATSVDQRFDAVDSRLSTVESQMVTRSYLDDKLSDLRGDLVVLVRKEDRELNAVVDELEKRDVFDASTADRIRNLEPFSRM